MTSTHDDSGNPLEIPNAVCVFERNIGDPAWRHFEVFAQTHEKPVPAEGRPDTELWPVMTTEWKTVHLMPHNFFTHNPAMTLRKPKE